MTNLGYSFSAICHSLVTAVYIAQVNKTNVFEKNNGQSSTGLHRVWNVTKTEVMAINNEDDVQ